MNYCDWLFAAREEWLDNIALVDANDGRRLSYGELQTAVRNLASRLRALGYGPGDVIATHLYNGAEAVISHLSIQYIGCTSCLLDPLITAQGLDYYLQDSRSQCLLTHLGAGRVSGHTPDKLKVLDSDQIADMWQRPGGDARAEPFDYPEDEVAALFYTSGTTSYPKGVMLCPRSFASHFRIFTRACYTYTPEDSLLCFVPFSHGYGSKSIFLPCVHFGAKLVMLRSFQPYKVAELITQEGITHIFGVPSHYQQLLRRDELIAPFRKLKAAFTAAALLKLETAQEWQDEVGFCLDEGYGLIETCTGVAFRLGSPPERLGHMGGYPSDLVEIEILDEENRVLPPGDRGEIAVRGPSVMLGYLNRPDETARALSGGWFHTGDMGYKDERDQLFLTGRIKDVINIAGIKVAPVEIEAALNGHPSVVESAVLGVPDETYGEVVQAFVQLHRGAEPDERALVRYLQTKLMSFQVPKRIIFVADMPRNNMGKVDKNALRDSQVER
jgi:long-chain acyl-CoA synthetase